GRGGARDARRRKLHPGAAAELPGRGAPRRLLARALEQRRARVRRQRARQSRRRRRGADRCARPLSLPRVDAAAARRPALPARGGRRVSVDDGAVDGRRRAVIEGVAPEIDCGRFAIKRVVGEAVTVEADIFTDGHDRVAALLLHRRADEGAWRETPLEPLGNDRWRGSFRVADVGRYEYTLAAWVDPFLTWRYEFLRRLDARDIALALETGAALVR